MALYHDCLAIWLLSYAMTNVLWEIPWVIFSRSIFTDLHTIEDVLAQTGYMRESILHMYWWVLASFGSVDLRTVNHDSTFFTVEIFAFANLATTLYFFHLNRKRSPYRYLIAVLGCGDPVAATFIFSFAEVFGGFTNMSRGCPRPQHRFPLPDRAQAALNQNRRRSGYGDQEFRRGDSGKSKHHRIQ